MLWTVTSQNSSPQKSMTVSMLEWALHGACADWPRADQICSSRNKHQKLIQASLQHRRSEPKRNMANSQQDGRKNKTPADLRALFAIPIFSFNTHISSKNFKITDEVKACNKKCMRYLTHISGDSAQKHLRIWTEVLPTPKSYKKSVTKQAL